MHEFRFKNNILFAENVPVNKIADIVGTPCYIYSYKTLVDHFLKLKIALKEINPLICYSVKANSHLALLKILVDKGAGLDIVSGGELYRALKSGINPQKIVYAGVGKTEEEILYAIKSNILMFNVESEPELMLIEQCAKRLDRTVRVALRINPGVDAHTHKYIKTGKSENKFGIDIETARSIFFKKFKLYRYVDIVGLHVHIGSQLIESRPFVQAIKKVCVFINALAKNGVKLRYLNIGGGLGIIYKKEKPQTADDYARAIVPLLKNLEMKIILEPGRFIAGNSGILVARVSFVKKTPRKTFIILNAGMNDLVRPSLYGAYHEVVPVVRHSMRQEIKADIVGPICESGDFFAKDRIIAQVSQGELLSIMGAGAYGFSMSSNYNSRPRACEVLVKGSRFFVIRRRERYADLIAKEEIPAGI